MFHKKSDVNLQLKCRVKRCVQRRQRETIPPCFAPISLPRWLRPKFFVRQKGSPTPAGSLFDNLRAGTASGRQQQRQCLFSFTAAFSAWVHGRAIPLMLATRVFGEALKVCHPQWLYGWRVLKGLFKKRAEPAASIKHRVAARHSRARNQYAPVKYSVAAFLILHRRIIQ